MMDLRQLRYFVTLGETLHFGQAANLLHISQPPLSRQIAALEQELGVTLLARSSRHVELTPPGARFLEDARRILALCEDAKEAARGVARGEIGTLRVGAMMHSAMTALPGIMRRFSDAYPRIRLHVREETPDSLVRALAASAHDIGVLFDPGPISGFEAAPIFHERLVLAIPAARAEDVPAGFAALRHERFIITPRTITPILHDTIVLYCRRHGFEPQLSFEVNLQQTILQLVSEGLGIALVPETLRNRGFPGVAFRDLDASPTVTQFAIWPRETLNPLIAKFIETATGQEAMPGEVGLRPGRTDG